MPFVDDHGKPPTQESSEPSATGAGKMADHEEPSAKEPFKPGAAAAGTKFVQSVVEGNQVVRKLRLLFSGIITYSPGGPTQAGNIQFVFPDARTPRYSYNDTKILIPGHNAYMIVAAADAPVTKRQPLGLLCGGRFVYYALNRHQVTITPDPATKVSYGSLSEVADMRRICKSAAIHPAHLGQYPPVQVLARIALQSGILTETSLTKCPYVFSPPCPEMSMGSGKLADEVSLDIDLYLPPNDQRVTFAFGSLDLGGTPEDGITFSFANDPTKTLRAWFANVPPEHLESVVGCGAPHPDAEAKNVHFELHYILAGSSFSMPPPIPRAVDCVETPDAGGCPPTSNSP
jgi:hypothetical protein